MGLVGVTKRGTPTLCATNGFKFVILLADCACKLHRDRYFSLRFSSFLRDSSSDRAVELESVVVTDSVVMSLSDDVDWSSPAGFLTFSSSYYVAFCAPSE